MQYRPEIEGLRTVAVTAVIIFHLNACFLKGGFYGVDVFFVISGYLITGILAKAMKAGDFSMLNFWARRIRRLVPLLLTVVIAVMAVVPQLVFRPYFKDVLSDVFPAVFSYFNIHAYLNFGDYWGRGAENSYFLHTWSLSVEEQFYLLYPAFLLFSYRYFKSFLKPLLVLSALSLSAFLFLVTTNREFAFYMLPARWWELSAGGILSCLPVKHIRSRMLKNGLPWAGILLMAASFFFSAPAIGYSALLPVSGTLLVIYFCSPEDRLGKILSTPVFTFTGKLSYSLYLWHWPVIVLFKNLDFQLQGWTHLQKYACILIITYLLSYLSYHLVEKKTKQYRHTPRIVLCGIAVIILLFFYFNSGLFSIHYKNRFNKSSYYLKYYDVSPKQVQVRADHPLVYDIRIFFRPDSLSSAFRREGLITRVHHKHPEIVLAGDSHGVMWAKTMDEIAGRRGVSRSFYTTNAFKLFNFVSGSADHDPGPYFTKKECAEYVSSFLSNIKKWKPGRVVMAYRWDTFTDTDYRDFDRLLDFLNRENAEIILINQPPVLPFFEDQNASQYFNYLGFVPVNGYNTVYMKDASRSKANRYLQGLTVKNANIRVIDIYHEMYSHGRAKITRNKEVLYFDDDHLSYAGTKIHSQKLEKMIFSR